MSLSTLFIEVFVPAKGESVVREVEGHHVSGIIGLERNVGGKLIVTNRRVAFLTEDLKTTIEAFGQEIRLRKAPMNISYERILSVKSREEKKLMFIKVPILEIMYESLEGPTRKIMLKIRDPESVANDIKFNVTAFRTKKLSEGLFPVKVFMDFVEFLAIEKAIKPLLYDTVSRCVVVGTSYFCIKDLEWGIEGSKDIISKAQSWISEYKYVREKGR